VVVKKDTAVSLHQVVACQAVGRRAPPARVVAVAGSQEIPNSHLGNWQFPLVAIFPTDDVRQGHARAPGSRLLRVRVQKVSLG
jgi:hypothetical protein